MKKIGVLTFVVLLLSVNGQAVAWGKTGHRVIGLIAEQHLTDDARVAVQELLGVEDLAEVSTWADFMRSDPDEFWQRTASPYHYVTVPKGKRYADVGAPRQGDALTAITQFAKTLKDDKASDDERRLALKFMVHVIGDLHQPLHVGNGTDRGGNQFTVVHMGEPTNLHSVWDSGLVDEEQMSYTEYAALLSRKLDADVIAEWSEPNPLVWIAESAEIRDTIYPMGNDRVLRWNYFYEHRDTVRQRLAQGGIRLAAYLNALFAE